MLECLIVGDSIAVGVAQHRPECIRYAKGGINSWQWNRQYRDAYLDSQVVVISLGSNDHRGVKTLRELEQLRERVTAHRVYWVLPHGNLKASSVPISTIQAWVKEVADKYNDTVLPIAHPSSDGIHPSTRGYNHLAEQAR